MEEGVVRMAAQMYALIAEMEAVKAEIEGMKALNTFRGGLGQRIIYSGEPFFEASDKLNKLSKRLRDEI